MKTLKLVTIGGGSSYTPELVEGMILRAHQLPIREWWFVDVEQGAKKQEIVVELARRMVEKAGLDWKIESTLDRREALIEADFVTSQFRVGQLPARYLDETIPLSYGMLGQETNGAGGIFKAFRTIEAYKGIIKDMKDLCPNSWLINFTNPAGIVTEAIVNELHWKKVIGLCNIPIGQKKLATQILGQSEGDLSTRHIGLNHFHFHEVWDKYGENRTQVVLETLYGDLREETPEAVKNITNLEFPIQLLRTIGMLPCDYHRYYFLEQEMLEDALEQYRQGNVRAKVVQEVETELFELYKDPQLKDKPKQLELRGGAYYSHNDSREELTVSTVNRGVIPYLPENCVVEVTSIISAQGATPLACPPTPPIVTGYLQLMKQMELVTVQAAMTGDYSLALQAFTLNPLISNGPQAEVLLQDMLLAHENYLPQFAPAIQHIKERRNNQ
ncbi:TPA: 6-phospho-beta-glucosidase [Streptococcus suis]|uniref:6-phospho-beta-glucosidase n=1 Tax=Streptococcus suis TaxID=1307 RepID=UPI00209B3950|nr:6-phospho-beta-glucosidase [Streptococcus suis]MCO8207135.1 6-phospho-beta-glucosidase [Streptococcus suis]MCO8211578.1 6-phospho-beta-glucosidase [Streptococcus suis]HEM3491903.1 6-phospho-beta-glucosidase [Streptococcus suis]HEM3494193.1 6-phospho-beta-glucosidase [Streptococcus suis]